MIVEKPFFSKETTYIIKGIAVIMMFVHHLFTFPSWWGDGINYPIIKSIASYLCDPFQMCIPIFCFLTGYTYYFNENKNYKYSFKKITDVLIPYWCVFFIYALIATIFGYKYSFSSFIHELFALERPTMIFCWYVYFYVCVMLMLPDIIKITSKNVYLDLTIVIAILPLFLRLIQHWTVMNSIISGIISSLAHWFPIVLVGFIFAKYSLFEKIGTIFKNIKNSKVVLNTICCVLLVLLPAARYFAIEITIPIKEQLIFQKPFDFWISLDAIYTPCYIFAVACICNNNSLIHFKKSVAYLGRYSLLMWFIQCIFFNNSKEVFQPILYFSRNPVLVLIWGLVLCLAVSIILDKGISKILKLKNEVLFPDS